MRASVRERARFFAPSVGFRPPHLRWAELLNSSKFHLSNHRATFAFSMYTVNRPFQFHRLQNLLDC